MPSQTKNIKSGWREYIKMQFLHPLNASDKTALGATYSTLFFEMELQSLFSLLTILSFLFSLLKLFIEIKRPKSQNKTQNLPPGPWKLPLIGNMHNMVGGLPHRTLRNLARRHGPLMHLQLGEISAIVISSARLAKEVLKTHDIAFASRPELLSSTIVAYNNTDIIFSPYGDYWRQMRKICTMELFSAKKVRSFCSVREDEVWNLIESIESSSGSEINLSKKIFSTVNAITCRAAFGGRCRDQKALISLIKELSSLAGGFDVADVFPSAKLLHILTGTRAKLMKIHKEFDQIMDQIINEHRENLVATESGAISREEEDLFDVLSRLKENGGLEFPITSDNVKAVMLDIFSAGTDTSSVTIEWAMSEMIRSPRVMAKAQAELRNALKGKEKVHEVDIQELYYLKLVIKETLRLHPPLSLLIPRECREQCKIDGYDIPVNTKVIVNVWAIGRDPENWKDAESFIPERFEKSFMNATGTEFEYLPFGSGRRMCPGISMGLINVELPLAQLLYHFNWKLPKGLKLEDLDVSEVFGLAVKRKNELCLIPTKHSTS